MNRIVGQVLEPDTENTGIASCIFGAFEFLSGYENPTYAARVVVGWALEPDVAEYPYS